MVMPVMADLRLAIIGCGNPNRSDDGVGPDIIGRLRTADLPDYVSLYDAGTDGMGVMYAARNMTHLIIIDARRPEAAPGAVYEVPGDIVKAPPPQSLNLHDFRWDHALYAGQKIYGDTFPAHVKVFLIEAGSLDLGLGLTAEVEAGAGAAADQIVTLARGATIEGWA